MDGEKVYIGDGAFASFDGFGIWLTTSNGIEDTNRVFLEPAVFEALLRFAAQHWDADAIANIVKATPARPRRKK
jgi:hypothetical protein